MENTECERVKQVVDMENTECGRVNTVKHVVGPGEHRM